MKELATLVITSLVSVWFRKWFSNIKKQITWLSLRCLCYAAHISENTRTSCHQCHIRLCYRLWEIQLNYKFQIIVDRSSSVIFPWDWDIYTRITSQVLQISEKKNSLQGYICVCPGKGVKIKINGRKHWTENTTDTKIYCLNKDNVI